MSSNTDIATMHEELASLKERIVSAAQRESIINEAKEQLHTVNKQLLDRLKFEKEQRTPFNQAFKVSCN